MINSTINQLMAYFAFLGGNYLNITLTCFRHVLSDNKDKMIISCKSNIFSQLLVDLFLTDIPVVLF